MVDMADRLLARADMFIDPGRDPCEGRRAVGDERVTLSEFLRCQRLTLQLKCDGLHAGQLAAAPWDRPRCRCLAWSGAWPKWTRLVPPPVRRA